MREHETFLTLVSAFLLMMIPIVSHSQSRHLPTIVNIGETPKFRQAGNADIKNRMPIRTIGKMPTKNDVKAPSQSARSNRLSVPATYVGGPEIMASLVSGKSLKPSQIGLYTFNVTRNMLEVPYILNPNLQANIGGIVEADTFHCMTAVADEFFGGYSVYHSKYSLTTGEGTPVEAIGGTELVSTDLTKDPTTGIVYGVYLRDDGSGYELATFDFSTYKKTVIDTLSQGYMAIAASNKGQLYAIGADGGLYKLDKKTAAATLVGYTGVVPGPYFQSATFDDRSNALYWASLDKNGASVLYFVDAKTGKAFNLHRFQNNEEFTALTMNVDTVDGEAPAEVVDFQVSNNAPDLTGTVNFAMPTSTKNGSRISGALDWYIVDNGDVLAQGSAYAGHDVSKDLKLLQGINSINVYAKNAAGDGEPLNVKLWAGYDAPDTVSAVTLTSDDNENVYLSWKAPTHGLHDGYMNPDDITYTIVRYPDKDTVAVGYKGTSFSESLKEHKMALCYYEVTANNKEVSGASNLSNKLAVGASIVPPYKADFSSSDEFGLWKPVDVNGDGYGWYWGYGQKGIGDAHCFGDGYYDDWLLSPTMHLEKGRVYTIGVEAMAFHESMPAQFDLAVGKGYDYKLYKEIAANDTIANAYFEWKKHRFSVDETGDCHIGIWWEAPYGSGTSVWDISNNKSQDDDGGCIFFVPNVDNDGCSMNTGKINVNDAVKPKLFFYYKVEKGADFDLKVLSDNASAGQLWSANTSGMDGEWKLAAVDLSKLKGTPYVLLKLDATGKKADTDLYIDNINVVDAVSYNVSLAATLPDSIAAGANVKIPFTVKNMGEKDAAGYKVELLVDGKVVDTYDGETLAPMISDRNNFVYHAPVDANASQIMEVKVVFTDDSDTSDNTTGSKEVRVIKSGYPVIDDLNGRMNGGTVSLSWSAPISLPVQLGTEDFESYDPFIISNIGPWTTIDGDKDYVDGFQGYTWSNYDSPQAWIVFNRENASLFDYATLKPHSGKQTLDCFSALTYDDNAHNDDWLISPRLPGASTISFYARSYNDEWANEKFEVLYSSTDTDTASFKLLAHVENVPSAEWTRYAFRLPDDARYFAIRCVTHNGKVLQIDDITYPVSLSQIIGYNIYRDVKKIVNVDANITSYDDTTAGGGVHSYNATVVYGVGESEFSNAFSITTGINNVTAEKETKNIYTIGGIRLPQTQKTRKGLFIVDGRKKIVR